MFVYINTLVVSYFHVFTQALLLKTWEVSLTRCSGKSLLRWFQTQSNKYKVTAAWRHISCIVLKGLTAYHHIQRYWTQIDRDGPVLTPLLRILEVTNSNLGPGIVYPDWIVVILVTDISAGHEIRKQLLPKSLKTTPLWEKSRLVVHESRVTVTFWEIHSLTSKSCQYALVPAFYGIVGRYINFS